MLVYWGLHLAALLSRMLPLGLRYALGAAVCDAMYLCWPAKRRNSIANAQVVRGRSRRDAARIARASWRNYGRYLIDFLRLPAISSEEIIATVSVPDWSSLDAALAAGKGALFVTAHYGCWDFGPTLVDHRYPGRVYSAAETFQPARLNALVQGHREAKGTKIIAAETGARQMMRVLRQNNVLTLLMDRPVHAEESGVAVVFFGQRTMVPAGAATLAVLTGAPIIPGYVRRVRGGRYEGAMGALLHPPATGDRAADIEALTQRAMSALEEMIRARPAQWYMFRPFWPAAVPEQMEVVGQEALA